MENTPLEVVYAELLSQITSYEYLDYTEEELNSEFVIFLKRAMSKFINKDFGINEIMDTFTRKLEQIEITILGLGMLSEWLQPKIHSQLLLKQQLSSKDFTFYSGANHLKELQSLKASVDGDFHYWMNKYALSKFAIKDGGKR